MEFLLSSVSVSVMSDESENREISMLLMNMHEYQTPATVYGFHCVSSMLQESPCAFHKGITQMHVSTSCILQNIHLILESEKSHRQNSYGSL